MQTWSTWREFPALGTGGVEPAHGRRVAHRNRVHRPLGADGERSLPCSVRTELDSGGDVPAVLHPAVLRGELEGRLLHMGLEGVLNRKKHPSFLLMPKSHKLHKDTKNVNLKIGP